LDGSGLRCGFSSSAGGSRECQRLAWFEVQTVGLPLQPAASGVLFKAAPAASVVAAVQNREFVRRASPFSLREIFP